MRIEVQYLGGYSKVTIGHLAEAADGRIFFEYDQEWKSQGIELSPVYLPNSTQGSVSCLVFLETVCRIGGVSR